MVTSHNTSKNDNLPQLTTDHSRQLATKCKKGNLPQIIQLDFREKVFGYYGNLFQIALNRYPES